MVYNSSINNLNSPENRNEFYLVVCFTTIMFSLSVLGAIYVLYRTYKSWVYSEDSMFFNKRCLNMSHKLPFYTSCIDFFDNCFFLINILYTAINGHVLEEPACTIFSFILWGFATLNLSLYLVIAIVTYFRICHDCKNLFCFGKYDFKLWLPVLISSSIFQLINMRNNGARKYWCSGKSGQIVSSIILFCLIIITLIIMSFCYFQILLKLNRCSKLEKTKKNNRRATRKILRHILIFIVHWIPIVAQNMGRFLKVEQPWLYISKSSGHAMGSIGNAIIYLINEGWKNRQLSFVSNQDESPIKQTINNNTVDNNAEVNININYKIDFKRSSEFIAEELIKNVMNNYEK